MDFRLKIFRDTFWMIRESDWTGTGLGCFDAVFPLYRHASILQQRVLHPESDWLWLAAETGLPGLLAMAGLGVWMGARVWEGLARRRDRPLQLALCVACTGMLAHSFVDVPGHRLGTVMPALLLLGLAIEAEEEKQWAAWTLRGAGVVVLALGAGAMGALAFRNPAPVVDGVEVLTDRALREDAAGRGEQGEVTLGQALAWEPLDWRLYLTRARMEGSHGELTAALGDFRRARFLEPNYTGLPYDEGIYWLNVAPSFAIEPWEDALRRTARELRPEWYQNMLSHAYPNHPELHSELLALAGADHAMQLVYLGWATPAEFESEIAEMLHENPSLRGFTPAELKRLFPIWMSKGDASQLASLMERRTEWLAAGYRALAEYDVSKGNLADAVGLMERYLPQPPTPPKAPTPMMSHAEAARRFEEDNGDLAAGMVLYNEAMAAGREDDALETLRRLSATNPAGCPGYVHYLEGQLLVKQQKLPEAWKALTQCPD
jgi:tetratricopeptide (TPR) repeat protein